MAYEERDLSGSLFKNDKKTEDRHPDYKGSALIGGVGYWVSAWIKTSQGGKKFMSLAFTAKDKEQSRPASQPTTRTGTRPAPATSEQQEFKEDESPF
jgi:hypothetical protein